MSIPGSAEPLLLAQQDTGGYQIQRSLRFNSSDSAYLSRTFSSSGNRRTWTWAGWVKRGRLDGLSPTAYDAFFSAETDLNNRSYIGTYMQDGNEWGLAHRSGGTLTTAVLTSSVQRDLSAWYHFVVSVDTTAGTASDRIKLYINGVNVTNVSGSTYPSQNFEFLFNNAQQHRIGEQNGVFANGYLADIHFIDGQALTPSSFTEVSATTGQLIPKAYTGTFTGNSFWLKFADNSAATATTLGKDSSGLGNNWTPNNLSVAPTSIDTSQKWSGLLSASGGSGFANQGAGGFAGYDDTNNYTYVAGASSGTNYTITLTPPSPISFTSSVVVRVESGKSEVTINGGTTWVADTGGLVTFTGPGSFSAITVRDNRGQYSGEFHSIKVDGKLLVDPGALSYVDSVVDTPTSYGTDDGLGGSVRGNYCTWNPLGTAGPASSNGNLDISSSSTAGNKIGTILLTSGKWYWECVGDGYAGAVVGVGGEGFTGSMSSSGSKAIGYWSGGGIYWDGGSFTSGIASYTTSDVIGVAVNMDAGTVAFYKNNSLVYTATFGSGTVPNLSSGVYPGFNTGNPGGSARTVVANFGQRSWAYAAPAGFKALCDTNLPAPTIALPSTVMDVKLYTGNGSTQTISGLGFSPDLVWIKDRTLGASHFLHDAVRGTGKTLFSNLTIAEVSNYAYGYLSAFNSDGFTVQAGSSGNDISSNTAPYVAWAFDAGSNTVSNTAGSITSSCRTNQSSGFSVIGWTGASSGTASIGHGLGVAPAMVIARPRNATSNWVVYHRSVGNDAFLRLNTTDASVSSSACFGTGPTSTVFTLNQGSLFAIAGDCIGYAFAPVAGYSSAFSYTGNGSSDGPFCFLGFRPRFLIIKRTDAAYGWYMYDTARDTYNIAGKELLANASDAEVSDSDLDILSNGFKPRRSSLAFNASGGTFVGFAWAESPFQYARAR